MEKEHLNQLGKQILNASIAVHREMGHGLLESVYEKCLMKEFELREISVQNQVQIPLLYKGYRLRNEFRIDLLVEDEIIIEIKSAEQMHPVYEAQLISYLKLSGKQLGYLINFNVPLLKDGFKRFVDDF